MSVRSDKGAGLALAVARLVRSYGAGAVADEVAKQTKRRRARPFLADWSLLHDEIQADARRLLKDECGARSDAEIALAFARNNPNPMVLEESTKRRIREKLKSRRAIYTLYNAYLISRLESPWAVHRAITEALARVDVWLQEHWEAALEGQIVVIDAWISTRGEPAATATFHEIMEAVRPRRLGMAPTSRDKSSI